MLHRLTSFAALLILTGHGQMTADTHDDLAAKQLESAREELDACGGRELLDAAVPDGPFLEACRTHDACYRSDAYDQGVCDRMFLTEMRDGCETAYPDMAQPLKHHACRTVALAYFKAVNSRFGSYAYSDAPPTGGILWYEQIEMLEDDGDNELKVCLEFENTARRIQQFKVRLFDEKGKWVDTEPDFHQATLQPGDSHALCIDSDNAPHRGWSNIGDTYVITLSVDDPDKIGLFDRRIPVARLDCDKASGTCVQSLP